MDELPASGVARRLGRVGEFSAFCGRAALDVFRPPYEGRETLRQVIELGWRSVPLIATSGVAVGLVLSLHTRATLQRFGAEALVAPGLGVALVRETGPLIAALLLAGRMGAGIAAEVAAMKVTEQVDALEATAVDSFRFLVVTRIIAAVIALPLLTMVMNFGGIFGGWLAEFALTGTPLRSYFERAFSLIDFTLYITSVLKTAVFGFLIAATGAYHGLSTTGGTEGVGRAATQSVVMASVLVIAINVVLVRLIFVLFPELQ